MPVSHGPNNLESFLEVTPLSWPEVFVLVSGMSAVCSAGALSNVTRQACCPSPSLESRHRDTGSGYVTKRTIGCGRDYEVAALAGTYIAIIAADEDHRVNAFMRL